MTQSSNPPAHGTAFGLLTALAFSINFCLGSQSVQAAVTDVQINALVSQAINTHPLVGSARAEQQATKEGVTAAKLNLLPTPNVSAGYDKDDDFVSQLVLRQPLWTAGRLTANVNQAVFDDKAATEYIFEQQNEVAKITIDAWQSYINAVARQRVSLNSLKTLNEFEEMMKRRVAQGVSAPIELNLASNRILQEQNAYQAAAEQQHIAAARLEQIIGEPLSQQTALSVPDLGLLVRQVKQQSVPFEQMAFNQASFYNPTVVREAYQVESAKQELEAQQAALYPSLYAQYEQTFYKDKDENDGRFSIGLDYTPGAGFSSLALSRASGARVDSLIESKEAARRTVMEDIQVKYQQFASAKSRELSLEAAVAGAQIVVDSYRRQFIAGRKTWTEVLNAVRELNDYQTQLAQTRSEILGSFYKLQVDFGLMPWQQFANDRKPVELFQPYNSVQDWLQQRERKAQLRQAGLLTPSTTDTILTPSQISFSDAENLHAYNQTDIIDYDALDTLNEDTPPLNPYRMPEVTTSSRDLQNDEANNNDADTSTSSATATAIEDEATQVDMADVLEDDVPEDDVLEDDVLEDDVLEDDVPEDDVVEQMQNYVEEQTSAPSQDKADNKPTDSDTDNHTTNDTTALTSNKTAPDAVLASTIEPIIVPTKASINEPTEPATDADIIIQSKDTSLGDHLPIAEAVLIKQSDITQSDTQPPVPPMVDTPTPQAIENQQLASAELVVNDAVINQPAAIIMVTDASVLDEDVRDDDALAEVSNHEIPSNNVSNDNAPNDNVPQQQIVAKGLARLAQEKLAQQARVEQERLAQEQSVLQVEPIEQQDANPAPPKLSEQEILQQALLSSTPRKAVAEEQVTVVAITDNESKTTIAPTVSETEASLESETSLESKESILPDTAIETMANQKILAEDDKINKVDNVDNDTPITDASMTDIAMVDTPMADKLSVDAETHDKNNTLISTKPYATFMQKPYMN